MNQKLIYQLSSFTGMLLVLAALYQFTMDTVAGRRVWSVSLLSFVVCTIVVHIIVAGHRYKAGVPLRRRNWFLLP
jgi:hypothetical protein